MDFAGCSQPGSGLLLSGWTKEQRLPPTAERISPLLNYLLQLRAPATPQRSVPLFSSSALFVFTPFDVSLAAAVEVALMKGRFVCNGVEADSACEASSSCGFIGNRYLLLCCGRFCSSPLKPRSRELSGLQIHLTQLHRNGKALLKLSHSVLLLLSRNTG